MPLAQLYGSTLGLVVVVGGGLVWSALTRGRRRRDDLSRDESLMERWRGYLRSRSQYNYWVFNLVVGLLFFIVAIIGGDFGLTGLALFIVVASVAVLFHRWGGRRPDA